MSDKSGIQGWADKVDIVIKKASDDVTIVGEGVKTLDKMIKDFQASAGTLSPEDKARMDAIDAASSQLLAKIDSIDITPPPPPPPPVG